MSNNTGLNGQLSPTAISLFCGAGGCSLGFEKAGYNILYASDINQQAIETYQKNFPATRSEVKNVDDIDFSDLLNSVGLVAGELDILIGGPPCQGFSTAGNRFWDDPRNNLLKSYIRALRTLRPKWFLMENVEGLLTSNRGDYVTEAAKAFIELGYKIRIEKVYAQEFNIPQRRKRVFIVGNSLGIDFSCPEPLKFSTAKIFADGSITIMDAIGDLPAPNMQQAKRNSLVSGHCLNRLSEIQQKRIDALESGQTMKDLPEHLQHDSFRKRANRRVADGTPTEKRGGAPAGIKKLQHSQPSLTITSAATREFVHPTENRLLTLRECARLQTFPDDFEFCGSASGQIQQVGNAIPPKLAQIFASHIVSEYGFDGAPSNRGSLLGTTLTKAKAMSPALKRTQQKLDSLMNERSPVQNSLFERTYD